MIYSIFSVGIKMIKFKVNLKDVYGYEYLYTYDVNTRLWVREDDLVSFTSDQLIGFLNKDRIVVSMFKYDALPNCEKQKYKEIEQAIKTSIRRQFKVA